jgi:hypothetical protein
MDVFEIIENVIKEVLRSDIEIKSTKALKVVSVFHINLLTSLGNLSFFMIKSIIIKEGF